MGKGIARRGRRWGLAPDCASCRLRPSSAPSIGSQKEVVPEARATVISLFAAALFVGSGVATTVAAPLAEGGSFGLLFAAAAVVAVPLGLFAALARWRYAGY